MQRSWILALVLACGGAALPTEQHIALPMQPTPGHTEVVVAPPPKLFETETDAAVPIAQDDPIWGSRDALVTIVEFTDMQCPYCGKLVPIIEQLQKVYGSERLRVVYKAYPLSFHPNAKPAAEAAATVHALGGDAAFWVFYKLAFDNQQDLSDAKYIEWAQQSGVRADAFKSAYDAHRFADRVAKGSELAKKLGVNGTPACLVNGVMISGAQPLDKFRTVVDEQIVLAKAKLESGTPRAELYRTLAAANFKAQPDDDDDKDDLVVWKIPATGPAIGGSKALVTIVEFADFQCPYCARVEPTLQQLRTAYGADLRLVFKHEPLPFHPRAEPAAELALEARAEKGDTGFWAAHDKLFAAQPNLEDSDLEKIAADLGLDVAKVKAAIATHKYKRVLDDDEMVSEDFRASGTPHFFINGRRLVGAQQESKFKTLIDEQLTKARALVAAGTKPEKVYDELMKTAQAAPPFDQKTVTLTGQAPTRGAATANVSIVEFADFQCPYCKKADDTIAQLLKDYAGRVKLVWRDFPLDFHQNARLAAEAAREAYVEKGADAFWKLHDRMFEKQAEPQGLERPALEAYALELKLDMTKFKAALDTGSRGNGVDADLAAGKAAGLTGAPAFLIGRGTPNGSWTGYYLSGAQSYSRFRRLIELSLAPPHP